MNCPDYGVSGAGGGPVPMGIPVSTEHLGVNVSRGDEAVVIQLLGELDIASAPVLAQALHEAEQMGAGRVVVDLRELEFMDSTGLHVLIDAARRSVDGGPPLSLRRGRRAVQQVFELTSTTPLFQFVD